MKITPKVIFTALTLVFGLVFSSHTQAQYMGMKQQHSVLFRINPLVMSPAPRFGVGAGVEFKIGSAAGLLLDGQFSLPRKSGAMDISSNYFGAAIKYYFNGYDAFEGFYGGGMIGITNTAFNNPENRQSAKHYSTPTGLLLGYHWRVANNYYIDLFGGPQINVGAKLEPSFGQPQDFDFRPYEGLTFRTGISIGYGMGR